MRVELAYVGPECEILVELDIAPGTSVAEAVVQSGIATRVAAPREMLGYAIFGSRVDPTAVPAEGDRIEVTRPLLCDPKAARRRRASRSS